jgi:hypothetical protein
MPTPPFSIAHSASNRVIFFGSSRPLAGNGVFQQHQRISASSSVPSGNTRSIWRKLWPRWPLVSVVNSSGYSKSSAYLQPQS